MTGRRRWERCPASLLEIPSEYIPQSETWSAKVGCPDCNVKVQAVEIASKNVWLLAAHRVEILEDSE